tara:strand:+ start:247 stop:969 length:723 start_codon:yes stop_codon:yes gene_type:complete
VKNRETYEIKKLILFVIFFIITNFLSFQLFKKVYFKNLYINGADFISVNNITENSSLQLPKRLIFIRTKLIEKELEHNISIGKISITRQIFPFGLRIDIQKGTPVAFAEREENGIRIKGFVDKDGNFIKENYLPERKNLTFPINIFGWKKDNKKLITLILKTYKNTNDLEVIKINSEGFVTLEEKFFQKIFLGSNNREIEEKLNLIFDIKEQLKQQTIRKKIKSLDLTDLTIPKIKVFIP